MRKVDIDAYLGAAVRLQTSRVRFAESFILNRQKLGEKGTDRQAEQLAIMATLDELTTLQAELVIAERRI